MKISCLPVSFFGDINSGRMTVGQWFDMAAGIGYDAADISAMFYSQHTPVFLGRLREQIRRSGIPLCMVAAYPDFTNPDAGQRARELTYLRRDICVTAELGGKYVRVLAGQIWEGVSKAEGIAFAVEGMLRAQETAEREGITLLFENHSKPGAWSRADFSHPTDVFLDICDRIRGSGIRLNYDTANTRIYGDDPLKVLERVIDLVETVHVADSKEENRLKPSVIGQGVMPIPAIFKRLSAYGFDGWLCVEEASATGEKGIRSAYDFVVKAWKECKKNRQPENL